jgi:DNA-binding IclR family transcriptional regulator
MSAPVFDAAGEVTLLLAVRSLPEHLSGAEVADIGRRLAAAADEVTEHSGGRRPERTRRR